METNSTVGRLHGKVAVITGGASGIGLATARRFAAEGASVVVGDRNQDALDALDSADGEHGGSITAAPCDVTVEADVARLMAVATERYGRLDVAFANAGIGSSARIVDAEATGWSEVLDVCLVGSFLTIKHAARAMTDGGSIVVTTSLNAVQPGVGMSAYCAAKAGAAMLVQVAALELGPAGIRVNAIAPGLVRTGLTDPMWLIPPLVDAYEENTPLGRHAQPDEIANLVTFLASDESAFISGSQYLVDGGAHTMRYPDIPGVLDGLGG
jgi:NAD(P)-dependent dehydrogenase (short-subunit alcohol dehydrogenase family)